MFLFSLTCPYCNAESLRRSRRHLFDWLFRPFGFSPFRCKGCSARFYVHRPYKRLHRLGDGN